MATNPRHLVQTSTEAKIAYKRGGYSISTYKQRSLERGAELDERAAHLREKEERRKFLKNKREQREKKEREARERNGVGLATQLIGYSHTQAQLKGGMEAFLGYSKKKKAEEQKIQEAKDAELHRNLEAITEEIAREPWDEDDGELPELGAVTGSGGDIWKDDDLDDDTLIEAHDLALSDPIEEPLAKAQTRPSVTTIPTPVNIVAQKLPKPQSPKQDAGFVRLHGPIDKTIEAILDKLPEPLIELLSKDMPKEPAIWNPALSLLHKLNPHGLPPHRLRVKIGCVVILLQDSSNSVKTSNVQHLQILRMDRERLECLILDGELEGTKTFLTRTAFPACHHNDKRYPFQRLQFPIKVSKDREPVKITKEVLPTSYKMPLVTREGARPSTHVFKKPEPKGLMPQKKIQSNPAFKLPGIPASKINPVQPPPPVEFDAWDDFLETGTQIARELSEESTTQGEPPIAPTPQNSSSRSSKVASQFSAKDFNFSLSNLTESPRNSLEVKSPVNNHSSRHSSSNSTIKNAISVPSQQKCSSASTFQHSTYLKRKFGPDTTTPPPVPRKKTAIEPLRPSVVCSASSDSRLMTAKSPFFEEFCLSTQDVTSLFDYDFDDSP
ncbi:hypothetical protein DM02DRAFT_312883 [Periconia macrospinosa]|uniref:ATP-dependent DNA helicase n=1 Tax=Periconia macrospinosa TaxID=97972 RepID=A0A2V1DVP3_9PLEO|nr:hypothetical protein DM02DRAFT_312883 [Periconia macrospinosa]